MSNTFSFEEAGKPAAGGEDSAPKAFSFEEASGKPTPKGFMGHARDMGLSVLQGAIGVSAAFLPKDAAIVSTNGQLPDSKQVFYGRAEY